MGPNNPLIVSLRNLWVDLGTLDLFFGPFLLQLLLPDPQLVLSNLSQHEVFQRTLLPELVQLLLLLGRDEVTAVVAVQKLAVVIVIVPVELLLGLLVDIQAGIQVRVPAEAENGGLLGVQAIHDLLAGLAELPLLRPGLLQHHLGDPRVQGADGSDLLLFRVALDVRFHGLRTTTRGSRSRRKKVTSGCNNENQLPVERTNRIPTKGTQIQNNPNPRLAGDAPLVIFCRLRKRNNPSLTHRSPPVHLAVLGASAAVHGFCAEQAILVALGDHVAQGGPTANPFLVATSSLLADRRHGSVCWCVEPWFRAQGSSGVRQHGRRLVGLP